MALRRFMYLAVLALALGLFFAAQPPQAVRAECGVNHTVVRGQNLFRISLRYGVSVEAIARANNIADVRRIYAGQVLFIPCASGTTVGSATTTTTTTTTTTITTTGVTGAFGTPAAPTFDCTGFRATSPLDGFNDGPTIFYWDAPRGGTSVIIYQVIVLDDKGARIVSFDTAGGITRVTGNVGFDAIGGRSKFSWFVIAIADGVEVCRTATYPVQRAWNANAGLSP